MGGNWSTESQIRGADMLLHDLLLPVDSRCFPSRQVAHRVPNSWCVSVASPCFALLPGPVSGPPGPRSVLRVRFFPIRCFQLLPVASRAGEELSGSQIRGADPLLPDPLLPVAPRCFPLLPGPVNNSRCPKSVVRIRCFPIRCFPLIFNLNRIVSRCDSRMS